MAEEYEWRNEKVFVTPEGRFHMRHNAWVDSIMPNVSGNEYKVLDFIYRKTWGFMKAKDRISLSQLQRGTGIKSVNTIKTAIESLADKRMLKQHWSRQGFVYTLNPDYEVKVKYLKKGSGSAGVVIDSDDEGL